MTYPKLKKTLYAVVIATGLTLAVPYSPLAYADKTYIVELGQELETNANQMNQSFKEFNQVATTNEVEKLNALMKRAESYEPTSKKAQLALGEFVELKSRILEKKVRLIKQVEQQNTLVLKNVTDLNRALKADQGSNGTKFSRLSPQQQTKQAEITHGIATMFNKLSVNPRLKEQGSFETKFILQNMVHSNNRSLERDGRGNTMDLAESMVEAQKEMIFTVKKSLREEYEDLKVVQNELLTGATTKIVKRGLNSIIGSQKLIADSNQQIGKMMDISRASFLGSNHIDKNSELESRYSNHSTTSDSNGLGGEIEGLDTLIQRIR